MPNRENIIHFFSYHCYERNQYLDYNCNDHNNNNKTKIAKQTKLETRDRQW